MKKLITVSLIVLALALMACGPVPLERLGSESVLWNWGRDGIGRALIDLESDELVIAFGIKASQSGILVAGHSSQPNRTMDFAVQTLAKDGKTILGTLAKSETFDVSDPSVLNLESLPAGTKVTPPFSLFLNRIGTTTRTSLRLTRQSIPYNPIQGHVGLVNEVVLRLADDSYTDTEGYRIITQPHFIYTSGDIVERYSSDIKPVWPGNPSTPGNLVVNGDSEYFTNFEYIAFAPAETLGVDFYYLVKGPIQDPNNANWMVDYVGNATIFEMVDVIVGLDPPSNEGREASADWQRVARYLKGYLAKFYKSKCIMFDPTCENSILFVAMNETLVVGENEGIQVDVDFSVAAISIDDGLMSIVGERPFVFSTSVLR